MRLNEFNIRKNIPTKQILINDISINSFIRYIIPIKCDNKD